MALILKIKRKKIVLSPALFCLWGLTIGAVLWRLYLILQEWPVANSDEATMGLMALHIAYRGEHPLVFYGQNYMGTIQAYLGATLMPFLGASFITLRLGVLLLYAAFLLVFYALIRRLFTTAFTLFVIILFSISWNSVLETLMVANGGYPELLLFSAFILLIIYYLAVSVTTTPERPQVRRLFVYMSLGVLIGLALWSSQIVLPIVLIVALLFYRFCRKELYALHALIFGLVLGLLPLIIYNITSSLRENSLAALFGNVFPALGAHILFLQKIEHTLFITLPLATGFPTSWQGHAFCSTVEPYTQPQLSLTALFPSSQHAWVCAAARGGWSMGLFLLWGIALGWGMRAMLRQWRSGGEEGNAAETPQQRQISVRNLLRVLLLASGLLWVLLFTISSVAGVAPRSNVRYLEGLWLVAPCVLWPVWQHAWSRSRREVPALRRRLVALGCLCLLGCMVLTCLQNAHEILNKLPDAHKTYAQRQDLIHRLQQLGATRIYSDYWTCNVLIFQSNERIICSTLNEQLQPGVDRYLPYRVELYQTSHPAYVFPRGFLSPEIWQKRQNLLNEHYQVTEFDGYIVYY